jgi:hypothetical protein
MNDPSATKPMGVPELIGGFSGGGIGSFIRGVINLLIGVLLLSAPMAASQDHSCVSIVLGITGRPDTTTRSGVNKPNWPSVCAAKVWM